MAAGKTITVKQTRSSAGRIKAHKSCLLGLGLRRINHVVTVCGPSTGSDYNASHFGPQR